jgi:hypothetical protein
MDKIKPTEKISLRFQISLESAKYFLGRVQKSFKTKKPSHQLIAEFIDTLDFESLPVPHQLAVMLNKSGVWTFPLNAEPPALIDEDPTFEGKITPTRRSLR